jgi:Ribbon-helix-helix protein, copG family
VTPKKLYTFAIDPDLAEALKTVKAKDGIGESEQIRRALRTWLEKRGVLKSERKRVSARKRS